MERLTTPMYFIVSLFLFCTGCSSEEQQCANVERTVKVMKFSSDSLKFKVTQEDENYFLKILTSKNHEDESILLANNSIPESLWLSRDTLRIVYNNLSFPTDAEIRKGILTYFNSNSGKLGPYIVVHEMDPRRFVGSQCVGRREFDSVSVKDANIYFYYNGFNLGTASFNDLMFSDGQYSVSTEVTQNDVLQYRSFTPINKILMCKIYHEWIRW